MTEQHDFSIQYPQSCLMDLQNVKQDTQVCIKTKNIYSSCKWYAVFSYWMGLI